MKYQLNEHQKIELCKLFDLESNSEELAGLIHDVEYAMTDNYLSPKGTRKKVVVEKIALLKDISNSAKSLRLLLKRLDKSNLDRLDSQLGSEVGEPYIHETITVGGELAKCWNSISVIKAVKSIEAESAFIAWDFGEHYKTASAWEINALFYAWPHDIGGSITISEHSKFINYLAIVLEEESTSALVKRVERCVGFPFSKETKK